MIPKASGPSLITTERESGNAWSEHFRGVSSTPYIGVFWMNMCRKAFECWTWAAALDVSRWIWRGARLTLADLSQTQLDLARGQLEAAGLLERVQAFHCLDMVAMHELADESYEVVVCYGAALSYTCDRYETALQELERVLCPGGHLLISVVSLFGTLRLVGPLDADTSLELPDAHVDWQAVLTRAGVVYTRPGSPEFHQPLVLFTSDGLRQALGRVGLQAVEMAAANPVVSEGAQIPRITASTQASAALTALEVALCNWPGLVDAGEHLLAVAFKRAGS